MRRPHLAVLAVLLLAGCAEAEQPPAAETTTAPAAVATGAETVPVRLLSHCGIRWAEFAGREWEAIEPRPAGGVGGYTSGTMTVLGPDRIRFDVTDPASGPVPGGVEFRPATGGRPLCG